jgi:hypothetical protein
LTFRYLVAIVPIIAVTHAGARAATAQSTDDSVKLIVQQGRPLRVALTQRITVKEVGQRVTGTLVEPLYAYDRAVAPAGTRVLGHVARLEGVSRIARIRAMAAGDFSPKRQVVLEFDTLVFDDGRQVPMRTIAANGTEDVALQVAGTSGKENNGVIARARQEVAQRTSGVISSVKSPGKMERLRDTAINRLPYHPQFLRKGTVYTAELVAPLDFGTAAPVERAPAGTTPAPESILNARLVTGLDSAKTPRGTPVRAVIISPVFSADHRLILPEGSALDGEVTFAKHAGHFHRNGQLRFLFESVHAPETESQGLAASLYSVAAGGTDHLAIDEEGGASIANSNTRFIAPALAVLALRATLDHEHHGLDSDDAPGASAAQSGNFGSRGLGGFFGFGLLGVGLSQISRPVGIALGVVGAARTVYTNVFGMGQEVSFPTDTRIQVQLAPGPSPPK